jgi:hypothetical protein
MPKTIKHELSKDERKVFLKGEGRPIKEYAIPILAAHRGGTTRLEFVELFLKQKYVDEFGEYVQPIGNHGIGMVGNANSLGKKEVEEAVEEAVEALVKAPKKRKKKAKQVEGVVEGSPYGVPEDLVDVLDGPDERKD